MTARPTTTPRKKSGRKRQVAGPLLLLLGVLMAGVWVASGWVWVSCCRGRWCADMGGGEISIRHADEIRDWPSLRVEPSRPPFRGWTWISMEYPGPDLNPALKHGACGLFRYAALSTPAAPTTTFSASFIPWPFALAMLGGGWWLVRSGRRARQRAMGHCLKCDYDLAGLAAGAPCPECGKGNAIQGGPPR